MDLLSRLGKGSDLVSDDAARLISGEPIREEYMAEAAQKAVENILAQNPLSDLGFITRDSVKTVLATVSPANV